MTTPNLRIITANESDTATLTSSPAMVATLPASNLQIATRASVARTTGTTLQHIYGTWTGPKNINCCALVRHNLSAAAVLRLKLYAGANQTGTLLYDSGDTTIGTAIPWGTFAWGASPWGNDIFSAWPVAFYTFWLSATYQAMSFDLQMTDSGSGYTYMQAARLFLGTYFEPTINANYGADCHWEDDSVQRFTDGGTLRTDPLLPYRMWTFNLANLNAGDRATLMDALRSIGKRGDMFVSLYPTQGGSLERDHAGPVKIAQMPQMLASRLNTWDSTLVLKET